MIELVEKIKSDKLLQTVAELAKPYDCYIVGGYIRDFLLGKTTYDVDLVVKRDFAKVLAEKITAFFGAHFVELDSENLIYRVVMPDKLHYFDISGMLDDDLKTDIDRRDLTINSIAINLKTLEIIDLNDGLKDFRTRVLKSAKLSNFIDDSLRILRVFRFCAQTGFDIDPDVFDFVKSNVKLIENPAKERVCTELLKTFEGKYSLKALEKADKAGLVDLIFPIMKEVKKIPPNSHHHLDLFHHLLESQAKIGEIFEKSNAQVKEAVAPRLGLLKLAAFLHDIGKPSTWKIDENGRHRFITHDSVGAKLVRPILADLKFSKKNINYIATLIKNHIYPSALLQTDSSEKAKIRFFRKLGDFVPDVILLAQADRLCALGPAITQETVNSNISGLNSLLDFYLENLDKVKLPEPLLNGHEISDLTKLPQSKELGDLVKEVRNLQLEGVLSTKDEAVKFVSEKVAKSRFLSDNRV